AANEHPYWYAWVIRIFHVNVQHLGPYRTSDEPQKLDVLWVRWYGRDIAAPGRFDKEQLHRIGFVDSDDPNAFGFLNPADVIRGAHLIPAFAHRRTPDLLPPSICARQPDDNDLDYQFYYVNMFVDRDMFMRYLGGGVGHKGT
ncbi:uncharacterized protein LAESUDRAFT_637273, partial [Laetiporus sulphureus 93-53]